MRSESVKADAAKITNAKMRIDFIKRRIIIIIPLIQPLFQ